MLKVLDEEPNIQAANLMELALFTGMHKSELLHLRWSNIDFERDFINIRGPKSGGDEKISFNAPARRVLESHPRKRSLEFIFPGKNGKQRISTSFSKPVNRIKKRAGLPKDFRPLHGLRHVYASMLASSGQMDMYTPQKLLTHKSTRMTQRYAHLRDEAMKRASNLTGELIDKTLDSIRNGDIE